MAARKTFSVIINNYNYGRFLGAAIDSVLAQTYAPIELIVVDDGSTDDSREVMHAYDGRLTPIFKTNGGQASALNAGFARASGEVVMFLDADDVLLPGAAEAIVEAFADPAVTKVHWAPRVVDESGADAPHPVVSRHLQSGDLRPAMIERGPEAVESPAMSANAFARTFLRRVVPIPEDAFRLCADEYLFTLAPLYGRIASIARPLSLYRMHGTNYYYSVPFDPRIEVEGAVQARVLNLVASTLRSQGEDVTPEHWPLPWGLAQLDAVRTIDRVVPPGTSLALVDQEQWAVGPVMKGRRRLPFLERDGEYWGVPTSDQHAIDELERMRSDGLGAIAFVPCAFWWFEQYPDFLRHLAREYPCVASSRYVRVFDVSGGHL